MTRSLIRSPWAATATILAGLTLNGTAGIAQTPAGPAKASVVSDGANRMGLETLGALLANTSKPAADNAGVLVSPTNIYQLVALLAQGAQGATRQQLATGLGADTVEAAAGWAKTLTGTMNDDAGGSKSPVVVRSASGIWMAPDLKIHPAYSAAAAGLGAQVTNADLKKPETIATINTWVAGKTEGRITELLPSGGSDVALIAAATTYFKGLWENPFDPSRTVDGKFAVSAERAETLPMMVNDYTGIAYRESGGGQGIILPYAGKGIDMTIVLPAAGMAMDQAAFTQWLDRGGYSDQGGTLSLPRFTLTAKTELTSLANVGWVAALTAAPDLSGIAEGLGRVSSFLHGVTVTVDEKGTEAAAASAATVSRSMQITPFSMIVNRPFFFFIRHRDSNAILFAGSVQRPAAPAP